MPWSEANSVMGDVRQAADASSRLTRAARECVAERLPQTLMQGGLVNGITVGPTPFLARSLAERWLHLGEEERPAAVNLLMTCQSLPNERIDDLLGRFGIPWSRAQRAGQLMMVGYEGLSYLLPRARGLTDDELAVILQHNNIAYRSADTQLQHMCPQL